MQGSIARVLPPKTAGLVVVFTVFIATIVAFIGTAADAFTTTRSILSIVTLSGILIVVVSGVWYRNFCSVARSIHAAALHPPIGNCLACRAQLHLGQVFFSGPRGMPRARHTLACPRCETLLESSYPFTGWHVTAGKSVRNTDFAWLYEGQTLAPDELKLIAGGGHTPRAKQKIHERLMARRTELLNKVAQGHLECLDQLTTDMVLTGQNIHFQFGNVANSSLVPVLKAGEKLWVLAHPITLADQRTRKNIPYLADLDRGYFFVTSQRYGFTGSSKNLDKKISDILSLHPGEQLIAVSRKGRKNPEIFRGVDGRLVAAILQGLAK